jgi:Pilus assembly protein, PilO
MSLSDRDKKIVLFLVPVLAVVAYWFLLLGPKRQEASKAGDELAKQEQRRDDARTRLDSLQSSKESFSSGYGELVRLGKAVPTSTDMPSLMVQLESAARGTGISFTKIKLGEREQASSASTSSGSASGSGSAPVAAGGSQTQSVPGAAAESANNAQQTANQRSEAAEKSGASPSDAQTSKSSGGGLPVGGGSAAPGGATGGSSGVPGLDTVPLELEFEGNFPKLADFFHRLKRFVRVVNDRVNVQGRLMTVEGLKFSTDQELFPKVKAELTTTVYLAPETEGQTAGATPAGPSVPAGGGSAPGSTPSPAAPTATAFPNP